MIKTNFMLYNRQRLRKIWEYLTNYDLGIYTNEHMSGSPNPMLVLTTWRQAMRLRTSPVCKNHQYKQVAI